MYGFATNGKVIRRKCKEHIALNFLVVRHVRSPHGTPTHEVIYNFGTYRSNSLDPLTVKAFWLKIGIGLRILADKGKINHSDIAKIRAVFARHMPLPSSTKLPLLSSRPISEPSARELLLERFKKML